MGAINYKTSEYITMGLELWNARKIDQASDLYDLAQDEIDRREFSFWRVTLEPGYYEGFSVNIEQELPDCFNDSDEAFDARMDVEIMRDLLTALADDVGLVACYPGWCTSYADKNETQEMINAALARMAADVEDTPVYEPTPEELEYNCTEKQEVA